jgi:hypothetical protein
VRNDPELKNVFGVSVIGINFHTAPQRLKESHKVLRRVHVAGVIVKPLTVSADVVKRYANLLAHMRNEPIGASVT